MWREIHPLTYNWCFEGAAGPVERFLLVIRLACESVDLQWISDGGYVKDGHVSRLHHPPLSNWTAVLQ